MTPVCLDSPPYPSPYVIPIPRYPILRIDPHSNPSIIQRPNSLSGGERGNCFYIALPNSVLLHSDSELQNLEAVLTIRVSLQLPAPTPRWGWGERKGCLCVFPLWPCSVGAEQAGSVEPSSSTSWQARQIFLYPHGTSSSHLKWEERGGGSADFPPGLNLSQLHADRLRKPGEDKQKGLLEFFRTLRNSAPSFSSYLTWRRAAPGFCRSRVHLRGAHNSRLPTCFQAAFDLLR